MALVRSFTADDGTNYPEAYSRILVARCDKSNAYVYVLTYSSFDDRMAGDNPIWTEEHVTELAAVAHDVFPASYAFLKTLPEFAGAVDHDNPPESPQGPVEEIVVHPEPVPDPSTMN